MVDRSTTDFARLESLEPRQFLSAGDLDRSFGQRGVLVLNDVPAASEVHITSAGKILVAASPHLLQFNSDGSPDTDFAGDGRVDAPFDFSEMDVMPDGRIVLAASRPRFDGGAPRHDWLFARFKPDGSLDTSLGGDGSAVLDNIWISALQGLAVQADGKIYAATDGTVTLDPNNPNPGGAALYLARVNPDGSLDTSFGNNGFAGGSAGTPFGAAFAGDLVILKNGNVEVVGAVAPKGGTRSVTSDVFDDTGKLVTTGPSWGDESQYTSAAVRNDGQVILVGSIDPLNPDYDITIDTPAFAQWTGHYVPLDFNPAGGDFPSVSSDTPGPGNKMYFAGGDTGAMGVTRLNEDGSYDNTWGLGGTAWIRPRKWWQQMHAYDVATAPDGDVIAAGQITRKGGKVALALVRFQGGATPPGADRTPPVAALVSNYYGMGGGPIAPLRGGAGFFFDVQYTADDLIDLSTLGDADIIVVGPNGYRQRATYDPVPLAPTTNQRTILGNYSISAPGGTWDAADNGRYRVLVRRRNVFDNRGQAVAAGQVGAFRVKLAASQLSQSLAAQPPEQVLSAKRTKRDAPLFLC